MMSTATPRQIGFIQGLAAKVGMDEDTRRDFLERETGHRSCKQLTTAQASDVIKKLQATNSQAVRGLDTPLGGKLRALWIAGYNLGLVRDRGDRAMLAFVERQTGVSHVRFLAEPGDAAPAIEALKQWLGRDAGVVWPLKEAKASAHKRAVVKAQWQRLVALGVIVPGQPLSDPELRAYTVADANGWDLESDGFDQVGASLGKLIRRAAAKVAVAT